MNFLRRKWNSTIRMRLTVLYAAAFFLAGLALIGLMYFQLNQVIGQQLLFRVDNLPDTGDAPATTFQRRLPPLEGLEEEPTELESLFPERSDAVPGTPDMVEPAEIQARMRVLMRMVRAETLKEIVIVSVVSLIAVSAVATILGWLLAGHALRPLRQITATARGIADRNLHQRIALEGPEDEIKDLANTLDAMLERLDRAFDSQQRFIANASHELRTPLTINRTLIEVAMMKESRPDSPLMHLGSTLLAVNQRHERLIDGLLMLASSEQEIADPRAVELAEVAGQVLLESAEMARCAGVEIRSQLDAAICRGDADLLKCLIQNLTDNAIRYNLPESGWIRVRTGTGTQGNAMVSVENSGPVIPSYEVPRLFEPFRRLTSTERLADSSTVLGRRGAGLGLSIVRSIVASHGGQLNAVPREEGGFLINVLLPAK
jgi:signal transduction histidine kinase